MENAHKLKGKYLTFSYDDGVRQDIRLIEIFKTYGLKATFNLNSGTLGSVGHITHQGFDVCFDKVRPDEVGEVYKGFEVACHGVMHRNFPELDDAALDAEVCTDKRALEALTGRPVIGGAYPCGVYDGQISGRLRARGIHYCRTIKDTHGFSLPDDFNLWHPTCHDHDPAVFELAERFLAADPEKLSVFYIWGHSFELDKNDCDRWYNIEKLCERLADRADVKYVTGTEIFDQVKESEQK